MIAAMLAESVDLSEELWLLLAGPAGAVATYQAIYRYYRNTDKSHNFESETLISPEPVGGEEKVVSQISRTTESSIAGMNSDSYRERVDRAE